MDKMNDYLKRVVEGSAEKIGQSAMYVSLFSEGWKKDPTPVLQLGLAMVMDKPIAIVVLDDEKIPENIRKVAVKIEYAKRGDTDSYEQAVRRIVESMTEH